VSPVLLLRACCALQWILLRVCEGETESEGSIYQGETEVNVQMIVLRAI
jgi:hypothetical protein